MQSSMKLLTDRTAIVTGAGRGIGRAVSLAIAKNGARVVLVSRTESELEEVAREIRGHGGEALPFPADVRKIRKMETLARTALQAYGGIHILVNNAGTAGRALQTEVHQLATEEWNDIIETNLTGTFHCCKAVLDTMITQREGHIINIASLAGKYPFPGASAYCASKAGLLIFSESLMLEARKYNIKVSCIAPGSVNTGFMPSEVKEEESWKLDPEDIAQIVVGLLTASPKALPSLMEVRPLSPAKK